MNQAVQYAELTQALGRLGYTQDAAEYHGALCGALCVQSAAEIDVGNLLEPTVDKPVTDAEAQDALERLRDESLQALEDMESSFSLLLPDDDADLASRTRALAVWCEGFLFGLSISGVLDLKKAPAEVREVVSDMVQFSHAATAQGDDAEVEENAYTEIVEYVRVGAQLIFMELHPRNDSVADGDEPSQTLH
jgi:hypothetical protein